MILIVVSFLSGILFEFLFHKRKQYAFDTITDPNNDLPEGFKSKNRILMASYYFSLVLLSNIEMFLLMSYNFYVFLSVLISNVLGFYLFGFSN